MQLLFNYLSSSLLCIFVLLIFAALFSSRVEYSDYHIRKAIEKKGGKVISIDINATSVFPNNKIANKVRYIDAENVEHIAFCISGIRGPYWIEDKIVDSN